MSRFDFITEMNKTVHPSFRRLVRKQFDNIDKQYNAVSRMKRVVKGRHWWNDWFNNCYYQSVFLRPQRMVRLNQY